MEARGKYISIYFDEITYEPKIEFINISDEFVINNEDKIIIICNYYLKDYKYRAISTEVLQKGVDQLDPFFESENIFLDTYINLRNKTIDNILDEDIK